MSVLLATQSEIAKKVAEALQVTIAPQVYIKINVRRHENTKQI